MQLIFRNAALAITLLPAVWFACPLAGASPAIDVQLPEQHAAPNTPYPVRYVIRWEGDASDWAVPPPNVEDPDWGTATLGKVQSSASNGVSTITYEVVYTPSEAGRVRLPELAFFLDNPKEPPAESDPPEKEPGNATALLSERLEIEVSPPPPAWLIPAVIAGGVLSLAVVLLFVQRRRRQKKQPLPAMSPLDRMQEVLHSARRKRLDGDLYAYYRELVHAAEFVADDGEGKQLLERFRTRTQEVGYKGMRPTDDILEGDMRDVERVLARRKEDFKA